MKWLNSRWWLPTLRVGYSPNRLQNSSYFCVFKYSRAVKQKVWNSGTKLKTESETGERRYKFSHSLRACEPRALRARKTLTPRFTDFVTDFEKKTDCFAVYSPKGVTNKDLYRKTLPQNLQINQDRKYWCGVINLSQRSMCDHQEQG